MVNYNPFSLEGRTILVIGASSGIGQKTAIECSRLGAKVVVCARNKDALQDTLNQLESDGHLMILAELTKQEDLERLVQEVPVVDGLVLSAGKGLTLPIQFATKDKFDDIMNINFFSPVETLRLLLKNKKIAKGASIVFVSSIGGVKIFNVGGAIYGASKSAIDATMKYCAKELAPKKIRVNSVNPGMTKTKLIDRGTLTEEQFQADAEKYPLKRYGETEDIAYGIIYLLSNASSWVTGQALCIDGGITI